MRTNVGVIRVTPIFLRLAIINEREIKGVLQVKNLLCDTYKRFAPKIFKIKDALTRSGMGSR